MEDMTGLWMWSETAQQGGDAAVVVCRSAFRKYRRSLKRADPHYGLQAHRRWMRAVKERAGYRCEAVEGGDPFSLDNGECLCSSHHVRKTLREKARREAR